MVSMLAETASSQNATRAAIEAWQILPWCILALVGLAGSALFSGAETGIYSLSRLRLRVRSHRGDPAGQQLSKDLFYTHTDRWTYKCVPLLKWCFRLVTLVPLLPILDLLGRASLWLISRGKAQQEVLGPRQEIMSLVQESTASGVLTGHQHE